MDFSFFSSFGEQIDWQSVYLIGTFCMALLISCEAISLKKHQGQIPNTLIFQIISFLEIAWLVASGVVLYYGDFNQLVKVVPVAYILYSMFGWFYGSYLLKDQVFDAKSIEDIKMPVRYADYSMSFSVVMILTCLGIFAKLIYFGEIKFT